MLFNPIEKAYMLQIGFSKSSVGIATSLYFLAILLTSTPAGILADRWSRKAVLMLSAATFSTAYITFSLSTSPSSYVIGSILWGVSSSLSVGLYDTVLFDTTKESVSSSDLYEKVYGQYKLYQGLTMASAALSSSLIVKLLGMRWTYILTIPFAILALVPLYFFKEPKSYKSMGKVRILDLIATLKTAIKNRHSLVLLIGANTLHLCLMNLIYTFRQFWYVELNISATFFGIIVAITWLSNCFGSLLERFFRKESRHKNGKVASMAIMLACALCLAFVQNIVVVVIAQLAFLAFGTVVTIFLSRELHDVFPSNVRASVSSMFQTIMCATSILLTLFFGVVSERSIFGAAGILVVGCLVILIYFIKIKSIKIEQL